MCKHISQIGDNMGNITLSIPKELHQKMKQYTELKWSEIARQAFEKKLVEVELMKKLLNKSKLSEKDAERIGNKIKGDIRKRFG